MRVSLTNFFSILFIFFSFAISAQTDTVINGKKYKLVEEKKQDTLKSPVKIKKKYLAPLDSEFVINNKRLKYYNNWLNVGAGGQQNLSYKYPLGFIGGLDYNFHIKHHYFQLGLNITGEKFGFYNNYQFHGGYGKRFEDRDIHFAGFAGLSYSSGYGKVDSVYTRKYGQPGVYLQVEIVKKVTYDVGIGAQFFADVNQEQSIIGLKAILYFSGAYKGKKNRRDED